MMDCKPILIKQEHKLVNDNALCLVEFSHASLKKGPDKIKYELYKGDVSYQKHKRILVASTGHLTYSGYNCDSHMYQVTSSDLKIAVMNKKTNKFKLYDVDYFRLKPILKCDIVANTTARSFVEQRQDLALQFGSKNKKKTINSRLKFQSSVNDTVDESIIQRISENIAAAPDNSIQPAADDIIPIPNKNASSPAEVYNVSDIITADLYIALESEITVFKGLTYEVLQTWKMESKFSDVIINYLEKNCQSITNENAKLLCYLHYLVSFAGVKYVDLRKKDPFPGIPEPYRSKMMERYLLKKSFPQRMKDKLLADAIILCLHLNHFCMKLKFISSSTKIGIKRLVDIAYALGCYVTASKEEKMIELKLPLYKHEPFRSKK